MFTGIIEEIGNVKELKQQSTNLKIKISCKTVLNNTKTGDSIAVDGICLTAEQINEDHFWATATNETINKTTLTHFKKEQKVNLERALMLSSRLGGHIVQGHIDSTATIKNIIKTQNNYILEILVPSDISKYIVTKGSAAIDGISLTVANKKNDIVSFSIIPETMKRTTLDLKKPGQKINIETDILAKYTESILKYSENKISLNKLKEYGF